MKSESEYRTFVEPHRRALKQIKLELDFFISDIGDIDIFQVKSRIKEFTSSLDKSERLKLNIRELDDIAGLRVIVGTRNDIPVIESFFNRQVYSNDMQIIKRNDISRKNGYRSLHLVVELKSYYQRSILPGRVEIQISTIFQHAFNFLSHSWIYKKSISKSNEWEAKFVYIAKTLDLLECQASELHEENIESTIEKGDSALTPHSLKIITKSEFGEDMKYDHAADLCRFYYGIGCNSNVQIKLFYNNPKIQQMWNLVEINKDKGSICHLYNMGKSNFWSMFGTRLNALGLDVFLNSLINNNK